MSEPLKDMRTPVKRETGANPVRTRHRNEGARPIDHWETGKMAKAMISESGDLPDRCTETIVSSHESLAVRKMDRAYF